MYRYGWRWCGCDQNFYFWCGYSQIKCRENHVLQAKCDYENINNMYKKRNESERKTMQTENNDLQKTLNEAQEKSIEPSNKGFQILQKMGYQNGCGLGKNGNGITEPIAVTLKTDRKGLGVEADSNKTCSRKQRRRLRKKNSRSEKEHLKLSQIAQQKEMEAALKLSHEEDFKEDFSIMNEEQQLANMKMHFEIPPKTAETPKPLTNHYHSSMCGSPPTMSNRYTDSEELRWIEQQFHEDIELLQLRLDVEASLNKNYENDLIVANIISANNLLFEDYTCEFIRSELVGWIGKYQFQQLDTPIFLGMSNNNTHITVVCENINAFQCLQQCVEEICITRKIGPILIVPLPPISKLIYCYDAVYTGVIREPELFLTQVKLHKPHLKTERWIIVSHEMCVKDRLTHFKFLIDEPSALALTYLHKNTLFICLQYAEFFNRGQITFINNISDL